MQGLFAGKDSGFAQGDFSSVQAASSPLRMAVVSGADGCARIILEIRNSVKQSHPAGSAFRRGTA
jgi:hypothetical protein